MTQGQITDPKAALAFILAGKATVTLRSLQSGARFTYKIVAADKRSPSDPDTWFVKLLNGPDNANSFVYIGIIRNREFVWTSKSRAGKDAPSVLAVGFVLRSLAANSMRGFEVWHEGRCGRCGKPLTVPESIASGFGPDCIEMVGGAAPSASVPQQRNMNFDGSARKPAAKANGSAAQQLRIALEQSLPQASGTPVKAAGGTEAEIRRRIDEYRANDPEGYSHDGELSEQEAFRVAYNMFRLQVERESR